MPSSLEKKEYAVFEMTHDMVKSKNIKPFNHNMAQEIVACMTEELNEHFMAELGEPSVAENEGGNPQPEEPNQFSNLKLVFVGGSHAYRMAAAADNLGLDIENLAEPGFRVNDSSIENKVEQLRDILESTDKRTVIIYHLYDNSVFFSCKQDGSRALPVKRDNVYHVEGRLDFADHHTVKHLVHTSVPLLRAGGDHEKIILSPFLRYLKACCRDKGHLTNRKDPDYFSNLGDALREMRESIKDTVYGKKIRSFKVLDPTCLLDEAGGEEATAIKLKEYLKEDPVHLNADGYAELVQGLLDKIMGGDFTRTPRQVGHSAAGAATSSTWRGKRQNWVENDDTVARRQYGHRGSFRGGFGGGNFAGGSRGGRRGGYRGGYNNRGGGGKHYSKFGGRGKSHFKKPY
jgi:hypothetical protein